MRNNRIFVNLCLHIAGLCCCILPPAICTLTYFPLWKEAGGGAVIAGGCALLLVLCAIPLYKLLHTALRTSASYIIWLIIFFTFFALSRIADQMTVISFAGLVGNLVGAILFKLGGQRNEKHD